MYMGSVDHDNGTEQDLDGFRNTRNQRTTPISGQDLATEMFKGTMMDASTQQQVPGQETLQHKSVNLSSLSSLKCTVQTTTAHLSCPENVV
ncbi:hypothetical protein PHET_02749 [Paragonimus heterotremus]|uniref:Uncharacterized protein n=1 Tax=Paragonimus heterotremus TaxID=100268 RepID=A0A8J4SQ25_9TREM|nr:hypothetical protein PHET_02749 [Paragonimus heterotremus]